MFYFYKENKMVDSNNQRNLVYIERLLEKSFKQYIILISKLTIKLNS